MTSDRPYRAALSIDAARDEIRRFSGIQFDPKVAEAYYNLFLTDHLAVIGNVEWLITGPNLVTGKTNHDVVIPGIRATVGF